MNRLVTGSVVSAVAMFLWGFLFWAGPPGTAATQHGANVEALRQALSQNIPVSGTYIIPEMVGTAPDLFARQHSEGPIATLFVRKEGAPPMSLSVFLFGFLHMLLSSLLMAWVLSMAIPALPTFGRRWCFVWLAGVVGTFWAHVADPIWFYHPWGFHVFSMLYDAVAWGLVGAILAWFSMRGARA